MCRLHRDRLPRITTPGPVRPSGTQSFRTSPDFTVPPGGAAVLEEQGESGDGAIYCTLSIRGGKDKARGLLCNVATGACSEAR